MENSEDIWSELREISPLLANPALRAEAYQAPEGYFDGFAGSLRARMPDISPTAAPQGTEAELPPVLAGLDRQAGPGVPEGYFEDFPVRMLGLARARELDSVAGELDRISPLLGLMNKEIPFTVPEGYFAELSDSLMGSQGVSAIEQELEKGSDLLAGLRNAETYQPPEKYFEELPGLLLGRARETKSPARVVPLHRRKPNWLRYGVAASLAGIVLTGSLLWFNPPASRNSSGAPVANLSAVSDQEIQNYLDSENVPLGDVNTLAMGDPNENEGKDLLGDVSDEELQQYLNEYVSPKDQANN
jgi:hypothetical protein